MKLGASLSVVFLALTSTALADPNRIYGKWSMSDVQYGFSITGIYGIREGHLSLTSICGYNGRSVTVVADAPAKIDDHHIEIMSSAHADGLIPGTGAYCNSDLNAESIAYSLNGETLLLIDPVDNMVSLKRVP